MSDTEDCSEADRLYIAIEPVDSTRSESTPPVPVTKDEGRHFTDLTEAVTNRELSAQVQQQSKPSDNGASTLLTKCTGDTYRQDGMKDLTAWNMSSPLFFQTNREPTVVKPFSNAPVSSLFRPFSPEYPVQTQQSYQQYYIVPQSPIYQNHYIRPSSTFSSVSDSDAEVSYYSHLSRDTYTPAPLDARSSATPSSVSSCQSITPTDTHPMVGEGEMSRKRKRSENEGPDLSYKRHGKPPYSYCGLIVTAIQNSPEQRLSLTGIAEEMSKMFEFFRGPYKGWRDSVRHNLSHSECFIKAELVSNRNRNIYKWSVDLSKVPRTAFCLQRTHEGKSGVYKKHIHEELELPPIELPFGFIPGINCRCNRPLRMPKNRTKTNEVIMSTEASTPLYHKDQLRLPVISYCELPKDSPEVYRNRDAVNNTHSATLTYEAITPTKSSDKSIKTEPQSNTQEQRTETDVNEDYIGIARYILATAEREGASSAVANLSFLC